MVSSSESTASPGGSSLPVKTLRRSHYGTVLIADRHCPDMHRRPMSRLVMKEAVGLHGSRTVQGRSKRTTLWAQLAFHVIAVQLNVVCARTAHYLMPQVAGDPLGAVIPKHDLVFEVNRAHADPHRLQNDAIDLRILDCSHGRLR